MLLDPEGAGAKLNAAPAALQHAPAPFRWGAAVTAWQASFDRARWPLPHTLHPPADQIRNAFRGTGLLGNRLGNFRPGSFPPRLEVIDDGDALRIVAVLPGLSRRRGGDIQDKGSPFAHM
ncbi:hypothetical protein [Caballeronia sp. RCC_10]|jgi:HSP20 family protein|uniref:hypothetical protein n=1 Tax=Caballeronia sp. RCC_10 TaxID=3239227 RepID=UPI003524D858